MLAKLYKPGIVIPICGLAHVPKAMLTPGDIRRLKSENTVEPFEMYLDPMDREDKGPIVMWRENENWLSLPVAYAVEVFDCAQFENAGSAGIEIQYLRKPDPYNERVLDPAAQAKLMEDMYTQACYQFSFLVKSGTGTGKTVCALATQAELGCNAIVVVTSEALGNQWVKEAKRHLGLEDDDIGWIQQDQCDYEGKALVIAIVHSLANIQYPADMYSYFGLAMWDECHRVGARSFSKTLGKLKAQTQIGLTATPKRKDGCQNVFLHHFGQPSVIGESITLPFTVYVYETGVELPEWLADFVLEEPKKARPFIINYLAEHEQRNAELVQLVANMHYYGRCALGISDRVEQLHVVRDMLIHQHGIPAEEIGMFTGYYFTGEKKAKYKRIAKDENGALVLKVGDTVSAPGVGHDYNGKVRQLGERNAYVEFNGRQGPAEWVPYEKLKGRRSVVDGKKDTPQAELQRIKDDDNIRIILATFQMMKEGQDIPRMDAGIDLSPISEGDQVSGRILRPMDGKPAPYWITPVDSGIEQSKKALKSRLRDYRGKGAEILDYA